MKLNRVSAGWEQQVFQQNPGSGRVKF